MYLLKRIQFKPFNLSLNVKNQLKLVNIQDSIKSNLLLCFRKNVTFAITQDAPENIRNGTTAHISYVSKYKYYQDDYGFKDLYLEIGPYEPDNIEGYILFIRYGKDIKTNGKKLFGRFSNEIIVVLENGEYVEFSGKRFEIENGMFIHKI